MNLVSHRAEFSAPIGAKSDRIYKSPKDSNVPQGTCMIARDVETVIATESPAMSASDEAVRRVIHKKIWIDLDNSACSILSSDHGRTS